MWRNIFCITLIGSIVFSISPTAVRGQGYTPYTIEDANSEVSITLNPTNPKPNEDFIVSLESYYVDLNSSEVSFYKDGKLLASENGSREYLYPGSGAGEKVTVKVTIKPQNNKTFSKETVFVPGAVSLDWEAHTYTPPFYQGKALYTDESSITFFAIADIYDTNGNKINPKNLTYNWKINGNGAADRSGLGRNTITLNNEQSLSTKITARVTVTNLDKTSVAEQSISVPINKPVLSIYEKSSLYGINWAKTISDLGITSDVTSLFATPYFFNTFSANSERIAYSWRDSNIGDTISNSNQLTLDLTSAISGIARFSVNAINTSSVFQKAYKNIILRVNE